jgi:hypothetical protein
MGARRQPRRGRKEQMSVQDEMAADIQKIRDTSIMQLNALKQYRMKDTYRPEDLNPYKRTKQRSENRAEMIKKLNHKGFLEEEQDPMPYTDEQVWRI